MLLKTSSETQGMLGYFDLSKWWKSSFNRTERNYIESVFSPLGVPEGEKPLTQGKIISSSSSVVSYLNALSGWFSKKEDRYLAYKILEKAVDLITDETNILDVHFLWGQMMSMNYKDRVNPRNMDIAIQSANKQISISQSAASAFKSEYPNNSLPSHASFKQLAIIYEKEKSFDKAITLCKKALNEGWSGEWEKRIERCSNK